MGKRRDSKKQHGMDVDDAAAKPAADGGWDYSGGAMDTTTDGGGGAAAGAPPSAGLSLNGDAAASKTMGLFGLVSGGVKKRKVQLSFKQKRRKAQKTARAVERTDREDTKRRSAGSRRETKNTLKKLW